MSCRHEHMAAPPPGRYLPVCLDCASRVISCDGCSATITAGPHIVDSGWMESGQIERGVTFRWSWCPSCWSQRSRR